MAEIQDFNHSFDTEVLLFPFLEVISSPSTTGLITSMALNSISKLFSFGLVDKNSKNISSGLNSLANAITHCRFEATDQAEDDGVLLRILALMDQIVCGDLGSLLSDESLCEIVESCLGMACQMRRGELLRRAAEMTMIKLAGSVFLKLKSIDREQAISAEDLEEMAAEVVVSETSSTKGYEDIGNTILLTPSKTKHARHESKHDIKAGVDTKDKTPAVYGLSSVREIFRVLISILDPSNSYQYTDSTRIMSLRVLTVAFEVSGSDIAEHASLRNLTITTLTKHLFQIIRTDNVLLLQAALRTTITVLHTCRQYLKLHQEYFFTYLMTCLSSISDIPREPEAMEDIFYEGVPIKPKFIKTSRPNTQLSTPVGGRAPTPTGGGGPSNFTMWKSPEVREVMVESLTTLVRSPSFFTDLFVNYDCDVNRSDLCEDLIGFFCRNAYPDSATWSTASVPPLCLEAILNFLSMLTGRFSEESSGDENSVKKVIKTKTRKKVAIAVADTFNRDPKEGIKLLLAEKFIPDDSPKSIAKYLRKSERLNKKVTGEFISKPSNKEILYHFIEDFDFSNRRLDEALREFLSTFRLPGESQQIERIFEKFASQYCMGSGNKDDVANGDAAFVLSYAVIMLNTDLHNPQIKRHMTLDQFKRNLRDANDSKNFREEYLEDIYRAIKVREIIMPDEHDNDESFEYAWKGLMMKIGHSGDMELNKSSQYDKHLFESSWVPIITTLSYVFATAADDTVVARVITGFIQAAAIAHRYRIHGVIDRITRNLSIISTLATGDMSAPTTNLEIQIEGEGSITVSDLSVPFGSDFKAQMATVTLFRISKTCTDMLTHHAWNQILPILANLYLYDLVKPSSIFTDGPLGKSKLTSIKPQHVFKRGKAGREIGLFSTISSYLAGYNDTPQEPSDEETDATYSAIDCVESCHIPLFLASVATLNGKQLVDLVDSIISRIPKLIGNTTAVVQLYAPTALFYLELTVRLAIRDSRSVDTVGAKVQAALYVYIMKPEGLPDRFLFQIIIYTLTLLRHTSEEFVEDLETNLRTISELNDDVLKTGGSLIVVSLLSLADEDSWTCRHVLSSDHYFSILSAVVRNRRCSETLYQFFDELIKKTPQEVTQHNLQKIVGILGQIANIDPEDMKTVAAKHRENELKKSQAALDAMYSLGTVIERRNELRDDESVFVSYVQGIAEQCANANTTIRSHAIGYLQRIMLAPGLQFHDDGIWVTIFDKVLFPLIETLLKPEIYELDPRGMAVTRLQCSTLLCKVFLAFIVNSKYTKGLLALWARLLETLDRLLNSGQRDTMNESVVEALKNVLLVLGSSKFGADEEFWNKTWARIDAFLPGLRQELFPEEAQKDREDSKTEEVNDRVEGEEKGEKQGDEKREEQGEGEGEGEEMGHE